MGLERLAAIMQHKQSNYDSDSQGSSTESISCDQRDARLTVRQQMLMSKLRTESLQTTAARSRFPSQTGSSREIREEGMSCAATTKGHHVWLKSLGLGNDYNFSGMAPIVADLYAETIQNWVIHRQSRASSILLRRGSSLQTRGVRERGRSRHGAE